MPQLSAQLALWMVTAMTAQQPAYQWTSLTEQAAFAPRDGAGLLSFDGKLWLLGGWNPGDKVHFPQICNSEVWSSPDGREWTLVNPQAPWEGRHTAGYVVHRGRMWIVGGDANQHHYQNDVWSSADGVTWELETDAVPWGPRVLHHTVAFDGKIWMMGGQTLPQFAPAEERFFNDVWCSEDGREWTRVIEHAPWSPRGMVGGSAVLDGRIWLLGGGTYDTPDHPQRLFYNDVWSSADGVEWTQVSADPPCGNRSGSAFLAFDGKLWVIAGSTPEASDPPEKHYATITTHNDVWCSADGANWERVVEHAPFAARKWVVGEVYRDHMFIIGGFDNRNSVNFAEVWYSADGATWRSLPVPEGFTARHEVTPYVFDDSLWIVAGNTWPLVNDVWRVTIPEE